MVTAVERSAAADATGSTHGFPAALTSFVGRAGVVDEIAGPFHYENYAEMYGPLIAQAEAEATGTSEP
jgi:hypothetical protein